MRTIQLLSKDSIVYQGILDRLECLAEQQSAVTVVAAAAQQPVLEQVFQLPCPMHYHLQ